ncbi:GMP synthase [Chryseobacterium sp.]|uniref:glutamine amidotransferase-related protein n=1 Tax=Chryseobacterium sp. TaxID=1871047 RepID=UPI0025BA04C9|nr:GMP synthase [Chryseobacterium sp.]
MTNIRIALLDMNNNHSNQGFRNIKELSEAFRNGSEENVSIEIFDVRSKNEVPNIEDFDIFISSGGPGTPHKEGLEWEKKYTHFLDSVYEHNKLYLRKKYLFLICHSFQVASIHWELGNICQRNTLSFGVIPIQKTEEGEDEFLFENLQEPFYGVDSRSFQFIEPNYHRIEELGMKIMAMEKFCSHVELEKAVMAVRFSNEIFGTQFHPEASPEALLENLKNEKNRNAIIENFGIQKYMETLDSIENENKLIATRAQILPRFLQFAKSNLLAMA